MLKELGCSISLVTDGGLRSSSNRKRVAAVAPKVAAAVSQADVYRYFNDCEFEYRFHYSRPGSLIARCARPLMCLWHRIQDGIRRDGLVPNSAVDLGAVPPKSRHLVRVDEFRVMPGIYSGSMRRAIHRTGAQRIDATGFDWVVVDSPHYVKVEGVARDRTVAVIHDLIPLEPGSSAEWRALFIGRLDQTTTVAGRLIFNSATTMQAFLEHYPDRASDSTVLYPVLSPSQPRIAPSDNRVARLLCAAAHRDRDRRISRISPEIVQGATLALALGQIDPDDLRSILTPAPPWNTQLPFFASVVSDEPRKNIRLLVEAAKQLQGEANIVIIGQANEDAYTGGEPGRYPNLLFTGYLDEDDKASILEGCAALIFPSLSEGFGLPIVEGAQLGRPVICSNIPVFREITDGRAKYFDPHDVSSLLACCRSLLDSPEEALRCARELQSLCPERYGRASAMRSLRDLLGADFTGSQVATEARLD